MLKANITPRPTIRVPLPTFGFYEFYDSIFAAAIKQMRGGLTTSPNILQCLIETMHDTQGLSTRRQSREKEICKCQHLSREKL